MKNKQSWWKSFAAVLGDECWRDVLEEVEVMGEGADQTNGTGRCARCIGEVAVGQCESMLQLVEGAAGAGAPAPTTAPAARARRRPTRRGAQGTYLIWRAMGEGGRTVSPQAQPCP